MSLFSFKFKRSTTNVIPASLLEGEPAIYTNSEGQITYYIGNSNNLPMLVNDDAIIITSIQADAVSQPTANGYYIFITTPTNGLPVGIALNDIAYLYNSVWYLTRNYTSAPATIKVGLTNQVVFIKQSNSWSLYQPANTTNPNISNSVKLFLQSPIINAHTSPVGLNQAGTNGNGIQVLSLSKDISGLAQTSWTGTLTDLTTRFLTAYQGADNLNVSIIPKGEWKFTFSANASQATGVTLSKNVYQIVSGVNTATVSGAGANTRTVTLTSGGFSGTYFSANATNTLASYVKLPSGIYQITAITNTNIATITVPTGYVNETAVAFSVWNRLFSTSSIAINVTAITRFTLSHYTTIDYAVSPLDKLGIAEIGNTTIAGRTLTIQYQGNANANIVETSIPFTDITKADKIPNSFAISNLATGGVIGTALATVDIYEKFNITQTTAGQTITLPNPTASASNKKIVYVENLGTTAFTIYGVQLAPSTHIALIFNGTNWIPASGGSGTLSFQSITSATATLTTFNQTVYVNATSNNITITLPTAVGNSGQAIEIKRIDNTTNTVRIIPSGVQTLDGETSTTGIYLFRQYNAITIRSDGTNLNIVNDNRESVGQNRTYLISELTTQTGVATNTNIAFNTVVASSGGLSLSNGILTIPANSGTFNLSATIDRVDPTSGSVGEFSYGFFNITTSTPVGVAGSINASTNAVAVDFGGIAFATIQNSPIQIQIALRCAKLTVATSVVIGSNRAGGAGASLRVEQISTQANVINIADYGNYTSTNATFVNGTDVTLNLLSGNLTPVSNTTITLLAGKTYEGFACFNANSTFVVYDWVDATTNVRISGAKLGVATSANSVDATSTSVATFIITPTTNLTIKLRVTSVNNLTVFNPDRSTIWIKQIGSTAVPKNGDGTIAGIDYRLLNNVEVATGDIWVDGKTIYRKRISYVPTIPVGTSTVVDAILKSGTYVAEAISLKAFGREGSNQILPLPWSNVDNAAFSVQIYVGSTGLIVATGSSRTISNITIVMEYTKI